MIEVTVARLRSRLASILETVRGGEPVVIRRHGARVAVLTGLGSQARRESSLRAIGGPSKLPRVQNTGRVLPVKVHGRLMSAPSQELSHERDQRMIRFFDSTGLVKALVRQEHGHKQAASLLEEPASGKLAFATARIAALEALSKIWRIPRDRGELHKLEHHFDKFSFYELDADYTLARELILKSRLKGADAGILSVAVGVARRERVVVQFISADQDQLRAARQLSKHDKIRIVSLPVGLVQVEREIADLLQSESLEATVKFTATPSCAKTGNASVTSVSKRRGSEKDVSPAALVTSERSQGQKHDPQGEDGRGHAGQDELGGPVGAFHNRGIKVSIWLWGVVQIQVSTSFRQEGFHQGLALLILRSFFPHAGLDLILRPFPFER